MSEQVTHTGIRYKGQSQVAGSVPGEKGTRPGYPVYTGSSGRYKGHTVARCLGQFKGKSDKSRLPKTHAVEGIQKRGDWVSLRGKGTGPGLQGEKSKDQRRIHVSGTAQGGRDRTLQNAKDSSQRTKDGRLRSTGKRDRTRVPRTKVQGPKNSARC
jgi:hypothetical protein